MTPRLGFLENHRGPYRFCLTRDKGEKTTAKHRFTTEWLSGEVPKDDVPDEAQTLLDDPRDCIVSVGLWSVKEEQFVGSIRR
jgi:hypothetical protein